MPAKSEPCHSITDFAPAPRRDIAFGKAFGTPVWSKWMYEMAAWFASVRERPPCSNAAGMVLPSTSIPNLAITASERAREVLKVGPYAEVKDKRDIATETRENDKAR